MHVSVCNVIDILADNVAFLLPRRHEVQIVEFSCQFGGYTFQKMNE
jgi:hypothetical protein